MLMKNILVVALFFTVSICFAQAQNMQRFGKKITTEKAQNASSLYTILATKEKSGKVKLKGEVLAVCKKKGCWMKMDMGDKNDKLFIRFKDYGFFVPKDCDGKTAVIEGVAKKETITVAQLRHYAQDAGKSKKEIEAINQPQKKYTFEATGVILMSDK
ncbi:hypothetical protein M23134_05962 [Microscilla marina ATCC 23134]|uniref:DUF4920 domain-containing protein n=2 Tax=Microscilla marina TaxID=1027 RepID=A1ZZ77_MICM2|nr:hypothetical protein M23134_05962 [Microscilla marina ATCC 23134]